MMSAGRRRSGCGGAAFRTWLGSGWGTGGAGAQSSESLMLVALERRAERHVVDRDRLALARLRAREGALRRGDGLLLLDDLERRAGAGEARLLLRVQRLQGQVVRDLVGGHPLAGGLDLAGGRRDRDGDVRLEPPQVLVGLLAGEAGGAQVARPVASVRGIVTSRPAEYEGLSWFSTIWRLAESVAP